VYLSLYCHNGPLPCGFNVAIKGLISDFHGCTYVCVWCIYNVRRRHRPDENSLTTDTLSRRLDHCNAEQLTALFDSATADQQSEIIRHKLRVLQRRLAAEDYAALTHLFRDNLRLAADHPSGARDSTTSPRRAAQSPADACRGRIEALARQVHRCYKRLLSLGGNAFVNVYYLFNVLLKV